MSGTNMPPKGNQCSVRSSNTHPSSQSSSQEDLLTTTGATTLSKSLDLAAADIKVEEQLLDKSSENGNNCNVTVIECAVCLQSCIHPVKLPCSHIFCYLCVKGVAFQSRRCAMCRQEIHSDFLLHPQLLDRTQLEKETTLEDGYQWFYEGRNGMTLTVSIYIWIAFNYFCWTFLLLYNLKAGGNMTSERRLKSKIFSCVGKSQ